MEDGRPPGVDLGRDPRVRELLESSSRWHTVEHRGQVTSTQDVALAALRDGVAPGLIVVADAQTSGRGRVGRTWRDDIVGPHGPGNLAISATLPAPEHGAELMSLAAGVALATSLAAAGADARLKWPNDLLVAGRKMAGILVERHLVVGTSGAILVGCGIDLDWRGVDRSGEAQAWTSLAEQLGRDIDRAEILVAVLRALDRYLTQAIVAPSDLLATYRRWCSTVGQDVRVTFPSGRRLDGRAIEVDRRGALVVLSSGQRIVVDAGDVLHVRPGVARPAPPA